jgi:hypothetical protein
MDSNFFRKYIDLLTETLGNSKLRLLLFPECNRKCRGCCNKDWELNELPICKSFAGYSEIFLTGGEPMLNPALVKEVATKIRQQNPSARIILYTAKSDVPNALIDVLNYVDGVTLTLHVRKDIETFRIFNELLGNHRNGKSLRLNVFSNVALKDIDTTGWSVKSGITWIKNAPLPQGEEIMRYWN